MLSAVSQLVSGAVIFDLDGVLIDSEGLQYQAYAQVLERFGVSVTAEEYARHWIATGRGPEYAVETYRLPVDAQQLRALKQPVYHEILRRQVSLMPGAIEALARLHARFPLGLATNSNRADVSFVMDQFGLGRFFASIVTREDYVLPSPTPTPFRRQRPASTVRRTRAWWWKIPTKASSPRIAPEPCRLRYPTPTRTNDFSLAAAMLGSLDELTVSVVERLLAGGG